MMLGLSLRVSWICLLLSCAAALPATKGGYNYPNTGSRRYSGGPGSLNLPLRGSNHPLMPQPGAPAWQPSSPSRPLNFLSSSGSSSGAPLAPAETVGYVSPPIYPGFPAPVFPMHPQPGSGLGGNMAGLYNPVGQPSRFLPAPSGAGSPSWGAQPAGGALVSFPDPSAWMPSRPFPDVNAWNINAAAAAPEGASETSPMLPPTLIVQSRNGYQRAREVLSNMRYSPEYPEPIVIPAQPNTPGKQPPMTGSKGGKGYRG